MAATNEGYRYRAMLNKLIADANSKFNLGIKIPTKENPLIFKFKNKIDLSRPINDNAGPLPLFVDDLDKLNDWVKNNRVSLSNGDKSADICAFFQYLYNNFDKFRDKINAAATANHCQLQTGSATGPASGAAPAGGAGATGATGAAGAAGGPDSNQLALELTEMINGLAPFYERNRIIFSSGNMGIIPYLKKVVQFLTINKAQDQGILNTANSLIPIFESYYNVFGTTLAEESNPQLLMNKMKSLGSGCHVQLAEYATQLNEALTQLKNVSDYMCRILIRNDRTKINITSNYQSNEQMVYNFKSTFYNKVRSQLPQTTH
jgi:hypothetical protein